MGHNLITLEVILLCTTLPFPRRMLVNPPPSPLRHTVLLLIVFAVRLKYQALQAMNNSTVEARSLDL
jgi:hypothetical protein